MASRARRKRKRRAKRKRSIIVENIGTFLDGKKRTIISITKIILMITITNRITQMKRSIIHIRTTFVTITLTMDTLICITSMELMMNISQQMKKTGVSGITMLTTVTV